MTYYDLTGQDKIVFQSLCNHSYGFQYPFASTWIAKELNLSLYQTRKSLRRLKECGLARSYHNKGGQYANGNVFCWWGWGLTKQASKTDEFKTAVERYNKNMREIFRSKRKV